MEKDIFLEFIENNGTRNDTFLSILHVFDSILNKYARLLNGDDTKQELSLYLFQVLEKFNKDMVENYDYKQIVSYLSKTLKHKYIKLSISNSKKINIETSLEDSQISSIAIENSNLELLDTIQILNTYEKEVITLIYIYGYTVSEIANQKTKSRQAINQVKNRALKKLKEAI